MAASYSLVFLISVISLVSANPAEHSYPVTNATLQGASSTFVVHSMSTPAPRAYPQNSMVFVVLDGKKYLFVDQRASWFEAAFFCQAFGLDLVSIESQRENELIREHAVTQGMNNRWIWLSASKLGRNAWMWLTGESLTDTFANWAPGEPTHPATEHCSVMRYNSGLWADIPCHIYEASLKPIVFVCEEP